MDQHTMDTQSRLDKGATLAEFALTLPILLLLLFGIIEFGRLFQSWVTLQNAARTAVRYASTGQYNEERYNIESIVVCKSNSFGEDPVGDIFIRNYERGHGYTATPVELFGPPTDTGVADESLYATWYSDPLGCSPGPNTDQNRKDIMRLMSIYEEARRGAAGLLKEDSRVAPNLNSVENYLFSQFQRPHPDVDKLDWFDVVICSTRDKLYDDSFTEIIDLDTGMPTTEPNDTARFELVLDDPQYAPAACVLREAPRSEVSGIPNNSQVPWMDAGGPGQGVTVVITFNHRLITPIGLADMVTLQAQRSAINESFRVTNAEKALGPSSNPAGGGANTPTPLPSSDTPGPTASYTNTSAPPTASDEPPTETPAPFSCDNIDVFFRDVPFNGNRLFIEFANFNHEDAYLLQSEIHWDKTPAQADYPAMTMNIMSLDSEVYWSGSDSTSPTIANDEGTLYYDPTERDHSILVPPGGDKIDWQGVYLNGPANMFDYFDIYDFSGTNFVFDHPDSDTDCRIFVYLPPIPTATLEPPGYESPTPTYTPDCASLTLSVEFVALEIAGDVTLRIINNGPRNAPFTGFNIVWPSMSGVGLDRVVFGGKNAFDTPEFGGDGVVMWDSPLGGGDTTPITDSATESTFITQVTVPAFSNTLVHLDFIGVAGKLPISPSDLNGSRFDIWCGFPGTPFGGGGATAGGGGGGPGGSGDGSIFLSEVDTPAPTNQPPPTWTPLSETNTPTNTPPPAIPTDTFTPAPTVPTQTPSNTPPASNTPTPTNTTSFGGGGVDG